MTTTPGAPPSYTTHELYALSEPFLRTPSAQGPGAVFGFPGPEPDPALYAAGLSTLALRNRLSPGPGPRTVDPGTAVIARLLETSPVWLRLYLATDGGRQAIRIALGPQGHAIFTQDGTGSHSVDLLASTGNLTDDLAEILGAVIRPLAARGDAVLLASSPGDDGERPVNLRITSGMFSLAAGPVNADGRLSDVAIEEAGAAARAMASRLLDSVPAGA